MKLVDSNFMSMNEERVLTIFKLESDGILDLFEMSGVFVLKNCWPFIE
ncbi:hypothetical protein LRHMDP2_778 [Lacticaseibacillus rhamnosus LRHMDP2]|uniref:Uncharacterized protein n=1 Tax=Lacticaseibacillus rhamnosus LRHMDP3 TaxID=1203259 RepID=A0AB33XYC2_LACRH|nr:hypothetical protein LRHMDP2_778 [Lacticaseibacillus rhamnosus LRHMDP2]EKS53677.1 hypothetical protein LRHMDP3_209 [Lacticaseibacillus rhamnosus LRHMDP3]